IVSPKQYTYGHSDEIECNVIQSLATPLYRKTTSVYPSSRMPQTLKAMESPPLYLHPNQG
ncbi:MAG: hypothetical protein RQ855_06615, partial [Desulfurococcales archaeon]|nr:hypothetical protein [Desulfurococcales archaeon]